MLFTLCGMAGALCRPAHPAAGRSSACGALEIPSALALPPHAAVGVWRVLAAFGATARTFCILFYSRSVYPLVHCRTPANMQTFFACMPCVLWSLLCLRMGYPRHERLAHKYNPKPNPNPIPIHVRPCLMFDVCVSRADEHLASKVIGNDPFGRMLNLVEDAFDRFALLSWQDGGPWFASLRWPAASIPTPLALGRRGNQAPRAKQPPKSPATGGRRSKRARETSGDEEYQPDGSQVGRPQLSQAPSHVDANSDTCIAVLLRLPGAGKGGCSGCRHRVAVVLYGSV